MRHHLPHLDTSFDPSKPKADTRGVTMPLSTVLHGAWGAGEM